jgi:hypothetical protein
VSTARRTTTVGATRVCPHCRAVVLQSAAVCPSCKKHLRFAGGDATPIPTVTPLRVEGSIRHPDAGEAWEYSALITISNDKGEEIGRHIVGVGSLQPGEGRTFSFSVEVFAPNSISVPEWGDATLPAGGSDLAPSDRRVR